MPRFGYSLADLMVGPVASPASKKALIGLGLGLAVGLLDYFVFVALGVRMSLGAYDLTLAICGLFAATYAVLGYLIGRLAATQAELRASVALGADSQRRALQAEKLAEIGQLAAGVAHEVRNPLGVIRSSTAMLIEDLPVGSEAARAGSFIVEEVDRLNAVVRALLDYARPLAPRRERLRVAGLLAGVRPLVEETLRRSRVVLRAGADELEIAGDPDLLAQLLLTLIENAAQAMPGGGTIEVSLQRRAGATELRVADDGPGVEAAVAGQIFEPFFTTRAEGTGLGLALAARVAEAHGGDLSLRPGEGIGAGGRGACFALRIGGGP